MRPWFLMLLATGVSMTVTAAPALAGGWTPPEEWSPLPYVALGVVCLILGAAMAALAFRSHRRDRFVEDVETFLQQHLIDGERRQEPDHVVVGSGLQDHDTVLEATPQDLVPLGAR